MDRENAMRARGRAAAMRVASGRRPVGVYTQGDFGPLVRKFEQTEMVADGRGRLQRREGEEEDYPEHDQYAVDQYQREQMRNFGAEAPLVEGDGPRNNRVAAEMVIRRTTGAGFEAPDHGELNLSVTGRDPRGTANEPDRGMMRRWTEARSGYLERTLGGQDSGVQEPGDTRPAEHEQRDRRVLAADVLRERLKLFTTAWGNVAYRAPARGSGRAAHVDTVAEDKLYGDRYGATAGEINDAMVRPANPATAFAAHPEASGWGGVPDHLFQVASYGMVTSGKPPGEAAHLGRTTVQDQELALSRQAHNYKAAMAMRGAFDTAKNTAVDGETFAAARAALQASGAPALMAAMAGASGGAGLRAARADAEMTTAKTAANRGAGQAHPHLRQALQSGVGRMVADGVRDAALASTEAFAKLARTPGAKDPRRARTLAHILEKRAGHFEPGEERVGRRVRGAPLTAASKVAARAHQGRRDQDFSDAKQMANYSAAPSVFAQATSAVDRHRHEPFNDQTRAAMLRASAPRAGVREQEAVRRAGTVENGTFSNNEGGRAQKRGPRPGRHDRNYAPAGAALSEAGGFGVSGGGGLAVEA